jgi:hypothetical protein
MPERPRFAHSRREPHARVCTVVRPNLWQTCGADGIKRARCSERAEKKRTSDGAQIDVLRNAVINVLSNDSNFLNNWNVLNNALRDARLVNGNQVVIGILSGIVPVALVDNGVRLPR